ncbi:hypothetical protein [Paenibacillus apiarius]|uniref:hypothetical protein n=1 Tax=Paenibacillus apiarius TaxID=46240 RepID=UPI003B3ADC48
MKTDSALFFQQITTFPGKDYNWARERLLTGFHLKSYLPSEPVKQANVQTNTITFVQSLPYEYISDIKGQLIVLIEEQQMKNMLTQIEGVNDGSLVIFNEKQEVLMSTLQNDSAAAILNHLHFASDYNGFGINGEDMILSDVTGRKGWKYVSVIPKSVVLKDVLVIKKWALLVLVGCLAAGLGASSVMAFRYYQPIKDVVQVLTHRKLPAEEETYRDEFDLIKTSVIRSMDEENKLRQTLAEQSPVLQANFLSRLIRGHVDLSHGMKETFSFMDIRLPHDYYGVILEEGHILFNFGVEGESYKMEKGYPKYTDEIMKNPDGLPVAQAPEIATSGIGTASYFELIFERPIP